MRGTVKKLTITRLDACTDCHGRARSARRRLARLAAAAGQVTQTSGQMRFKMTCSRCGGTGRVRHRCAGYAAAKGACGARIRSMCAFPRECRPVRACASPGRGNAGTNGAPPGDLYIITEVQPHPFFDRRGDDLYTVVPITVTEAALGAKIEVPTIDGRSLLRVPPGTNSGQKLRLREKGVPSVRACRASRRPIRRTAGRGAEAGGRARARTAEGTGKARAGRSAQRYFRTRAKA